MIGRDTRVLKKITSEPCANLDTVTSKNILELFRKLNRDLGQTIVIVSHEPWHTEYFDRVITLCDGEIFAW
jgi:putative ABC transport system ATP-binding protein